MSMFLKITRTLTKEEHDANIYMDEAPFCVYADIVSCHFRPYTTESTDAPNVWGEAKILVREPVKTLEVSGFCENQKTVVIDGDAFLMNEQGRTISKFVREMRSNQNQSNIRPPK